MSFVGYPNGAGGLTGDVVAVGKPLILGTTGHVWYVGPGGVDAGGVGVEREKPLKTVGQAYANAANGDGIVFLENHAETISSTLTIAKTLVIASEGTGSTRAKLTCNVGGAAMLTLSAVGIHLRNIYFPASTATPTARVSVTVSGIHCDGCYFECGGLDLSASYLFGAVSSCRLSNATFVATAAQPGIAISCPSNASGLIFENVALDGGTVGFSSAAFTALGVLTGLFANQVHQLNNADVSLAATWTGLWMPGSTSGSARFEA